MDTKEIYNNILKIGLDACLFESQVTWGLLATKKLMYLQKRASRKTQLTFQRLGQRIYLLNLENPRLTWIVLQYNPSC